MREESIYSATFAEYIEHGVLRRTAQTKRKAGASAVLVLERLRLNMHVSASAGKCAR